MTAAIRPAARVSGVSAYRVPGHPAPVDLDLRGNEGAVPDEGLLRALAGVDILRRYPDVSPFRGRLAARYGVSEDRVLVTAGGDDALDRLCRAVLEPGRSLLLPTPGFEMTCRYARLAGASVVEVPWPGAV
ncbi:MAG: aminotransferase class I/II-fold pyridoxal phosphate-dependent enzyme, partial [Myxococcota bacterium]|nr:aminotransferase class I/II-fold pyridoxal phosphate-dependent enzyme [Myxococcota bacterium]